MTDPDVASTETWLQPGRDRARREARRSSQRRVIAEVSRRSRVWFAHHRFELAEVGFVLLALVGLMLLVGVAWTMLTAGLLGLIACERASTVQRPRRPESSAPG